MEDSLEKQFKEILSEFNEQLDDAIEDSLTSAGNTLIKALQQDSPVQSKSDGTPHFRDCWAMKTQYHHVRYVGNTKLVHDNIPLSNLLEYGSKGKPFINRTFELNKEKIYSEFVQKLGGKIHG